MVKPGLLAHSGTSTVLVRKRGMDRLAHGGPSLSVKDSDDDGESTHALLGQPGTGDDPAVPHDGEGELFTAVQLSEATAEHYMDKGSMHIGTGTAVAIIPKLVDGQAVQLEDGSTAYISNTYKEGSTVIHLEDGSTAYITSEPPDGLIFAGNLDGCSTASTIDGCIVSKKMNPRAVHPSASGGGDRHFKCEFDGCGKTFATGYGLKSHTRVHTGEKPYKCPHDDCEKSFKTSGDLQKHVRTHTGERPFTCPFEGCGRSFTTSNIRKVHIRTHTGERPYTCDAEGCGKAFASATNYKNHIRIHSGEKPYVCSVEGCNKRFTEYSSLYKHHVVHTHTKPYTCSHCGKNYRQTSTLAMHRRTTHGEDDAGDELMPQQIQILNPGTAVGPFDAQQVKRLKLATAASGGHSVVVNPSQHSTVVGDGRCLVTGSGTSALQGQPIAIANVGATGQDHQIYIVTNPAFQVIPQLSQSHLAKLNDPNSEPGDTIVVDEGDQLQHSPSAQQAGGALLVAGYSGDSSVPAHHD